MYLLLCRTQGAKRERGGYEGKREKSILRSGLQDKIKRRRLRKMNSCVRARVNKMCQKRRRKR